MYAFASLPENLAAFCEMLRRTYGFRIGIAELRDAARALEVVPLADESRVRAALRAVLSCRREDLDRFDGAFTEFFLAGRRGVPQEGLPPTTPRGQPIDEGRRATRGDSGRGDVTDGDEGQTGESRAGDRIDDGVQDAADAAWQSMSLLRASWSPTAAQSDPPIIAPAGPTWRAAARTLVRRVRLGRSRRWRPASRGPRFDLRRTLRASLHTGGEALAPRWIAPPRRSPRFVLLIDGSRSMSPHTAAALDAAVALASVAPKVDVFTFSTRLRDVTAEVREAAGGHPHLLDLSEAWGGGTAIGACLRAFVSASGERLLSRHTVIIVFSDGLDIGEPDTLRAAMRELHASTAGLIWANPLLRSAGYQPTALGMRVALPYITTFTCVATADDLATLARHVRLRE
jgi:uncharacterized protein